MGVSALLASLQTLRRQGFSFWRAESFPPRPGKLIEVSVRGGPSLTIRARDSDLAVLRQVFVDRHYHVWVDELRERIQQQYEAIVADDSVPVIIDAGANIGAASIWFADLYPEAAVIAVEPDPESAKLLRRNIAAYPRIAAAEVALGGTSGAVALLPSDEAWTVRTERASAGCPAVTIDQLVAGVPKGALFAVKIDIEGFEADVFAGDTRWLDDAFVVFVEPHDWMLPGERTSAGFQREFGARQFEMLILADQLCYVRHGSDPLPEEGFPDAAGHSIRTP